MLIGIERRFDIILCVDGSGSMGPCIDKIKENAKTFYKDLKQRIEDDYGIEIKEINVKIIVFRDYAEDGKNAMTISRWFNVTSADSDEFKKYVDGITAEGGGDEPENGLEALFFAMSSDWKSTGDKDRQFIVLLTDADALSLKERSNEANYPTDMVDDMGLIETWMGECPPFIPKEEFKLKSRTKRLIMFAPQGTVYEKMQYSYNRSFFIPTKRDEGLKDILDEDVTYFMKMALN